MKIKKVITTKDIHTNDLEIVDNKLRLKPTRLAEIVKTKAKELSPYILDVVAPSGSVFIVTDSNTNARKMVTLNGLGVGIVNLDFTCKVNRTRTVAFRMPAGAPLPMQTISAKAGSGVLWWNKGSRDIIFVDVLLNERVLLNLVGFFA